MMISISSRSSQSRASNSFLWHLLKYHHIKPLSMQPLSARSGVQKLWAKDDLCIYCLLPRSKEALVITTFEKSGLKACHVSNSGPLRKHSRLNGELAGPLWTLWCSQENKQTKSTENWNTKKCYLSKLRLKNPKLLPKRSHKFTKLFCFSLSHIIQ